MSNAYQLDTSEYDENDEGTIEYLDLDLEVDCIPESAEEYMPELPSPKTKPTVQSTDLKPRYMNNKIQKRKQTQKLIRAKQMRSSTDPNSMNEAEKRKNNSLSSATVHEAVSAINAKLADSAQSLNGLGRTFALNERVESQSTFRDGRDDLETMQTVKTEIKTEGHSLDLFFQSMAQTVMLLPSSVQAKIKMDICKVIAMAEIKHCSSDAVQDANKF